MSAPLPPPHAAPSEQPPDAGTLKNTQRETRRLIDMSRAPIQIAFGAWCLAWAAAVQLPFLKRDADMGTIWWALGMMFTATITQRLVLQARKQAGVPNVAIRKSDEPGNTRRIWIALVVAIGVAVGLLSFATLDWLHHPGPTAFGVAVFVLVVPLVYRGFHLGLWEHFLQAGGLLAGMVFLLVGGEPLPLYGLCLCLGFAELVAGISLHRRWQAWIATLPRCDDNTHGSNGPSGKEELA